MKTLSRQSKRFLIITSALFILNACGGGGSGDGSAVSSGTNTSGSNSSGNKATAITLTPGNSTLLNGKSVKLKPICTYSDNSTQDISGKSGLSWASSNTAVATVDSGGNVTAIGEGTATINATYGGISGSSVVTVPGMTNKVLLYIATSSSSSQYLSQYDISLSSDNQTLIRIIPADSTYDVLDTFTSPSYAPSTAYPYTSDNRMYIRRDWRPYESGGSHELYEYDPLTGKRKLYFETDKPNSANSGCSAILGSTYYYEVSRTKDAIAFYPTYVGGDLRSMAIVNNTRTGTGTTLIPYGDANNCKGSLEASSGGLYDAEYNQSTHMLSIYKRDLTTGKIIGGASKSWTLADYAQYKNHYYFAFDGGVGYWARQKLSGGQFEIWKNDFSASQPSLVYKGVDVGLAYFDVSNGHIAIGDGGGKIFVYDEATQMGSIVNVGVGYYGMQILYIPK